MTNEKVREQYEEIQRKLGFDCKVFKYMGEINEIQNLTRKDEREKVIGEIEKLCKPSKPICESNLGMESFKAVVLATLNSLREAK